MTHRYSSTHETQHTSQTMAYGPVDVVILGGGLAGLTLAMQLKQNHPRLDILVVEKNQHPVPEAAFKVGESSVEIAGYYFREVLGLKAHLSDAQLVKQGFRFFHAGGTGLSLAQRPELGTAFEDIFASPDRYESYQLDRGRFENKLGDEIRRLGVTFWDGCKVLNVSLTSVSPDDLSTQRQAEKGEDHTVTVAREEEVVSIQAHWVVDASGQVGWLKRQLNLEMPADHDVNAVWFRVNQPLDMNQWSQDAAWRARVENPGLRIYSTTHLCGAGYWVWLIPLASGSTSVGIVADEALHPLATINRLERALAWLQVYEPECAHAVAQTEIQDFKVLKHFAHGCKQVFSAERWCLTGIAGVFTDPLFSPGSDLISISNSMITDLIGRERSGEAICERAAFFNRLYLDFVFDSILQEYAGLYPTFGCAPVMAAKKVWNVTWYWGILAILFCHRKFTDPDFITTIEADLWRFHELQQHMQRFLKDWHALGLKDYPDTYASYLLSYMYDLYDRIGRNLADEQLRKHINKSVKLIEALAFEIFQQAPSVAPKDLVLSSPEPELRAELDRIIWHPLSQHNKEFA